MHDKPARQISYLLSFICSCARAIWSSPGDLSLILIDWFLFWSSTVHFFFLSAILEEINLVFSKIGPGANEDTGFGPYFQSKRLHIYSEIAHKLVEVYSSCQAKSSWILKARGCVLLFLYTWKTPNPKRKTKRAESAKQIRPTLQASTFSWDWSPLKEKDTLYHSSSGTFG